MKLIKEFLSWWIIQNISYITKKFREKSVLRGHIVLLGVEIRDGNRKNSNKNYWRN